MTNTVQGLAQLLERAKDPTNRITVSVGSRIYGLFDSEQESAMGAAVRKAVIAHVEQRLAEVRAMEVVA